MEVKYFVIFLKLISRELSGSRLVRCYGNLYSQARVEALEKLDLLPQLVDAIELKSKILFSVVVVSKNEHDASYLVLPSL